MEATVERNGVIRGRKVETEGWKEEGRGGEGKIKEKERE